MKYTGSCKRWNSADLCFAATDLGRFAANV